MSDKRLYLKARQPVVRENINMLTIIERHLIKHGQQQEQSGVHQLTLQQNLDQTPYMKYVSRLEMLTTQAMLLRNT